RIHDQALIARLQIADPECGAWTKYVSFVGFRAIGNAAAECDVPSVGRDFRSNCAAAGAAILLLGLAAGDLLNLARLEIHAANLRAAKHRIGVTKGQGIAELHIEVKV